MGSFFFHYLARARARIVERRARKKPYRSSFLYVHCYKNDSLGHRVWLEVPTVWMKNHRKLRDERRKSTWDSYPNSLDIIGQLVCTYAQQHECRILKCWMKQFAIKCLISQHQKQYWSPNSLHWLHQIVVATLQFFGAIPTSRY